jgi:hypothetical protein
MEFSNLHPQGFKLPTCLTTTIVAPLLEPSKMSLHLFKIIFKLDLRLGWGQTTGQQQKQTAIT